MPTEDFRTSFPDLPHRMSGRTLNKQNRLLNALAGGVPLGMNGINTTGIASAAPWLGRSGPMIVTDAGDDCAEDTDEADSLGFPCRSSKKYRGKFRNYKSGATGEWLETDEDEKQIDMSPWWPSGVTSGPILLVDDIIFVSHNSLRGCYVPLDFPRSRPVILNAALSAGAAAEAAVLEEKTTSPWWQKVTGVTLQVWDLSLNSGDPAWQARTKGIAVWNGKRWIFVPISCTPDDTGIA